VTQSTADERSTLKSLSCAFAGTPRIGTYISIRGEWHYLYRAVDKQGKTVDFLLRRDRGIAAAQAFFRRALATNLNRRPRRVTLDGQVQSARQTSPQLHQNHLS
jgi:transposase-like protein